MLLVTEHVLRWFVAQEFQKTITVIIALSDDLERFDLRAFFLNSDRASAGPPAVHSGGAHKYGLAGRWH
jgi:hypothetical protein